MSNEGNWLAIQRQLLQLERQQAHLMNMFQDFTGKSHDNMVTSENRVRGLERVIEDMARDLSISSGRRVGALMPGFEGSSTRPIRVGPVRHGEGPSARSVWLALKDEATPEAIRVAREDNGTAKAARVAVPESSAEAMGGDNIKKEQEPIWISWKNAMR
ncbi:hypothetical protein Nepgr_007568 [Nepenthes gracilis]|uniref:Uncharacterized protein n=1 Tax=Nepenthes gracilis TaxID=150966 RepID=A0AAD3XIF1_NEPGR|nr:hypothetical protein Nepgr_007568 [Nepenthes gracilis]